VRAPRTKSSSPAPGGELCDRPSLGRDAQQRARPAIALQHAPARVDEQDAVGLLGRELGRGHAALRALPGRAAGRRRVVGQERTQHALEPLDAQGAEEQIAPGRVRAAGLVAAARRAVHQDRDVSDPRVGLQPAADVGAAEAVHQAGREQDQVPAPVARVQERLRAAGRHPDLVPRHLQSFLERRARVGIGVDQEDAAHRQARWAKIMCPFARDHRDRCEPFELQ